MLYDPKWEEKIEVKLEPWQEILLKAADIIEEKGWIKGRYHSADGYCVIGALRAASGLVSIRVDDSSVPTSDNYVAACDKLTDHLQLTGRHLTPISWWNDFAASKDVIVNKLREVAANAI